MCSRTLEAIDCAIFLAFKMMFHAPYLDILQETGCENLLMRSVFLFETYNAIIMIYLSLCSKLFILIMLFDNCKRERLEKTVTYVCSLVLP